MTHPADKDHPFGWDEYAQAIELRFPELDSSLDWLGNGWDFDALRAGDWVLRFPRRAEVAASLDRQPRIGSIIREVFEPLGLQAPVVELVEPAGTFPYRFTRHRLVEGVGADELQSISNGLAHELGRALGALHGITTEQLSGLDVMIEADNAGEWLDEARELTGDLPVSLATEFGHCVEWIHAFDGAPPVYDGPLRFLHDDLAPEHVIVDPETGSMVGLIDFDDARWGDPALDFMSMRAAIGADFVDHMLVGYGQEVDTGFRERVDFMARVKVLDWLLDAHLQGTDVDKHRRWVHNAFS